MKPGFDPQHHENKTKIKTSTYNINLMNRIYLKAWTAYLGTAKDDESFLKLWNAHIILSTISSFRIRMKEQPLWAAPADRQQGFLSFTLPLYLCW